MNIVVLTSRYPSKTSPYSHMFVHIRSKEYIQQGHTVQVLVPSKDAYQYQIDGVNVTLAPVDELVRKLEMADRVMIHLLYHRIDKATDAGTLYKQVLLQKIPTLFFIHGVETQTIWNSRRDDIKWLNPKTIARFIYRDFYLIKRMVLTLRAFAQEDIPCKFVTPSKWMMDECYKHTKVDLWHKHLVIPNGIDTELFEFREQWNNRHKLMSIRPLVYRGKYAVDLLLDSTKLLGEGFNVTLFGRGPDESEIQQLADSIKPAKFELKSTFLNHSEIPLVHAEHGIYAAVTRMDAQGVSMCEAMASGLPTISFDTCAIPEFIESGKTGILATSYDVTQFSQSIEQLVDDRELFENIARNARLAMEQIDIKATTKRELCESL